MRRFLHNVTKGARKLKFSASVKNGNLYFKQISAHFGICKSVNNTDFVLAIDRFRYDLSLTKVLLNSASIDNRFCKLLGYDLLCDLSANSRYLLFEASYTRFSGIVLYYFIKCVVCYFAYTSCKSMTLELSRNKVVLCYMEKR